MSEQVGRRELGKVTIHDAPSATVEQMLANQDALIDAIQALTAKLDADSGDTGGDSDYADKVSDSLNKLDLIL